MPSPLPYARLVPRFASCRLCSSDTAPLHDSCPTARCLLVLGHPVEVPLCCSYHEPPVPSSAVVDTSTAANNSYYARVLCGSLFEQRMQHVESRLRVLTSTPVSGCLRVSLRFEYLWCCCSFLCLSQSCPSCECVEPAGSVCRVVLVCHTSLFYTSGALMQFVL